ncbi:2-oxoglutarate dehydrogenase E1 component [Scopulibacillus darangshiensis]|uniref:2-oxoglutarate dehydrogenase E1 component n=1 Tax=Scopulibacillus darangshiensis TaxID=442528 RepID=A0A4R2NBB3_9BACL|nr:2-oxoglutarate dehydrogenase E1 component [Scopulibacillus darangshiensis]TCP18318.1 2-oxoglutarate dehydrogenase E1 component [Scopulibacillus darangshiensis]
MATERGRMENPWEGFYGPNLGYIQEQYENYINDRNSVDTEVRDLFDRWGPPPEQTGSDNNGPESGRSINNDTATMEKVVSAVKLAENIRTFGHLAARINPLEDASHFDTQMLKLEEYQLSKEDLKAIPAKVVWPEAPVNLHNGLDVINHLREAYSHTLAYEFSQVHDIKERDWLNRMVEHGSLFRSLSNEARIELLNRLTQVEGFESFLHKTFVGQKRFSIEGVDAMVPMLDELIRCGIEDGTKNVMIGMAHRGRLNVLAHVLGKPYQHVLAEFHHSPNKELVPSEGSTGINYGWTGDVKYHLGADRIEEKKSSRVRLTLANNPSHLEFVNPVVQGYARAAQENRETAGYPEQDNTKALAIIIHGDAAFPGEGIVAESLNLSRLKGYQTGGSIHIIANNQLGFTTDSSDSRSTKYASDLAKGFEIPIVHVNADDPEACLDAMNLAYQYRKQFHKDFLINLLGYRRYGHNEMDDPHATNPLLYAKVDNHPTVRAIYEEKLVSDNLINKDQAKEMEEAEQNKLQSIYDKIRSDKGEMPELDPPGTVAQDLPCLDTAVSVDILRELNEGMLKWPKGFNVYSKLGKILQRRGKNALEEGGKVDWGLAESLAFASILRDGTPIRFTGQDVERGTFAHRHLVLHDSESGKTYSPLHVLKGVKASFDIHNSPLSEASVLGFEYGYDVFAPETLVLWEAQFGDFANAGQVIFDQFIAAGRAKWGQKSGLVMLLPHGYEGQGPEHSSGRLERYLQSAAENNWTVANLTSAAQYFHILRRQAAITLKEEVRPLIIMTPKSLLRNPHVASPGSELSAGRFEKVFDEPATGHAPDEVKRLVLCSGKVAIDLETELSSKEENLDWLHILRVEQLYPFPEERIREVIGRYKNLKEIVWVQEEPKNMGAWMYIQPKIWEVAPEGIKVNYIGRPDRSSPAGGEPDIHKKEQKRIVTEALSEQSLKKIGI